jgi:hypothetical protein
MGTPGGMPQQLCEVRTHPEPSNLGQVLWMQSYGICVLQVWRNSMAHSGGLGNYSPGMQRRGLCKNAKL